MLADRRLGDLPCACQWMYLLKRCLTSREYLPGSTGNQFNGLLCRRPDGVQRYLPEHGCRFQQLRDVRESLRKRAVLQCREMRGGADTRCGNDSDAGYDTCYKGHHERDGNGNTHPHDRNTPGGRDNDGICGDLQRGYDILLRDLC